MAELKETLTVYMFVHRPPHATIAAIGRIACIGLAAGTEGSHRAHNATALGQSDDAVFAVVTLHLLDRHVGVRLKVYTTIGGIHEQLANDRRAVNDRTRKFYAIDEWEKLLKAIDEGRLEIIVLNDHTRDDARFKTSYQQAHGIIVKQAREDAQAAPRCSGGGKPCIVMTFDNDRLWEA